MNYEDPFSIEDLKIIKDHCSLWGNNCGGCETCDQVFGNETPPYDHQETFYLVSMIEHRNNILKKVKEFVENPYLKDVKSTTDFRGGYAAALEDLKILLGDK